MAINNIGDSVRAQLSMLFMPDAPSPAKKQGRVEKQDANVSGSDSSAKWSSSPSQKMPFGRAEASWLQHALGDSYCDDWALAHNAPFAAQTMLRQCQPGSILIMHSARRRTRRELVGWPHEESTRASVCRVRVRRPSASA